jgi:uncharacterized protein (DUF433 family)
MPSGTRKGRTPMLTTDLEKQLLALNPVEKAEAIQILTKTLSNGSPGITKTPGVMGGDACIAGSRLPVWLFVSLRRQGASDAELFESYPQLSAADLVNVWAYAEAHPEEIETAIREQDEAMESEL